MTGDIDTPAAKEAGESQRLSSADGALSADAARNRSDRVVLSVEELKKRIGRKWIIKGISFEIREGEIFGFLGPNGSGKTTTIRMLVDLIRPTEGHVTICGHSVRKAHDEAMRHIGSIVENPEMYPYLTGYENLEHYARMQRGITQARIREAAALVGLDKRIHDKVKTYSLGMKQRLGIAQALLGEPKLLILDEPTNGLDPQGIKELRKFLRGLAAQGMSLMISSHLLSEVQAMCDCVAIINRGKTIAVGRVEELLQQSAGQILWSVDDREKALALFRTQRNIEIVPEDEWHVLLEIPQVPGRSTIVTVMDTDGIPDMTERLVDAGVRIYGSQLRMPSLEELFLQLTEGEQDD